MSRRFIKLIWPNRNLEESAVSGAKIIEALKEAGAGDLSRVTIDGQLWIRQKPAGAADMVRYVEIAPVVQDGFPDAHHVFLHVTNQRFCVTPYACETKEDAEWTRDMLCVALAKIA